MTAQVLVPTRKPRQTGTETLYRISALQFSSKLLTIFFYFLLLTLCLKGLFVAVNWSAFRTAGFLPIGTGLLKGLRFDLAALGYCLIPALILYFSSAFLKTVSLNRILLFYLAALAFALTFFSLADIQYFEEAGKHFTYEALDYMGLDALPAVSTAFKLHPWLSAGSLAGCIGSAILTWVIFRRPLLSPPIVQAPKISLALVLFLWISGMVIIIRGGFQPLPLSLGHALISSDPYINGLCLNPVFSILRTTLRSSGKPHGYSQERDIEIVRGLLDIKSPLVSPRFPLVRHTSGIPGGNRKNVVLFILESWPAKDVGALGGRPEVTPFFDQLARQGMLFVNFYAGGIRTFEGILSTLCSFPNQPTRPLPHRPEVYQTQWRALSQILADEGYLNIFVHGRDLEFDHMRHFLRSIHFHRIIDRHNFSPSSRASMGDSWPGYGDEEVMRRANEEFSRVENRPFFGVIYTMSTHPPFDLPPDFPKLYPPTTRHRKFLNSLHYADYALRIFFELAQKEPYFPRTLFVLVADHALTRDVFNYSNQHHIPFLVYSPGYIHPSRRTIVAGQTDILPTILGMLQLQTRYSAWGRDLSAVGDEGGFAFSVSGGEVHWHADHYLLVEGLVGEKPFLFDLATDPQCTHSVWDEFPERGRQFQNQLKAYVDLSQRLLYENRIYPRPTMAKDGQ